MEQTAVEWLIERLNKQGFAQVVTDEEIEEALEMEKQQLCYFYVKGAEAEINNPYVTNIEFYNKTFKK
jgi:hypothetical protein